MTLAWRRRLVCLGASGSTDAPRIPVPAYAVAKEGASAPLRVPSSTGVRAVLHTSIVQEIPDREQDSPRFAAVFRASGLAKRFRPVRPRRRRVPPSSARSRRPHVSERRLLAHPVLRLGEQARAPRSSRTPAGASSCRRPSILSSRSRIARSFSTASTLAARRPRNVSRFCTEFQLASACGTLLVGFGRTPSSDSSSSATSPAGRRA